MAKYFRRLRLLLASSHTEHTQHTELLLIFIITISLVSRSLAQLPINKPESEHLSPTDIAPLREDISSRLALYADAISKITPNPDQGLTGEIISRASAALLAEARSVKPEDVDLLYRILQPTTQETGEELAARAARRTILRLNPSDIINQWQVIVDRLAAIAEPADQFKTIDRFLSPAGAALDATVRSRLALLAASLENDGNHASLVQKYLSQAQQLDTANVDALLSLLQSSPGPIPSGTQLHDRAVLLLDWMKADPFNATPALTLARLLNRYQSYHTARYLGDNLRLIAAHHRHLIDTNVASTISLSILGSNGPVQALDFLDDYENRLSQSKQADLLRAWEEYDRQVALAKERGAQTDDDYGKEPEIIPPAAPPVPLDQVADIRVTLPIALDIIRLASARLSRNPERMQAITGQLAVQFFQRESQLRSVINDTKLSDDSAQTALEHLLTDRLWLRLWLTEPGDAVAREKDDALFGRTIADDFNELKAHKALTTQAVARFGGWLEFRNDNFDEARARLTPIRIVDPQSAFCLALMYESENDIDGAVRGFAEIRKSVPGSLLGIYCGLEMRRLRDRALVRTAPARMLDELLQNDVAQLRGFIMHPDNMVSLTLELPAHPIRIPLYEPLPITLTIANNSPFSLAVGEGQTVDPRVYLDLFLIDNKDIDYSAKVIPLGTIVRTLDLFTLRAGQSVHVTFRPDRSVVGLPLRDRQTGKWYLHARVYLGNMADTESLNATATSPVIESDDKQDQSFGLVNADDNAFLRFSILMGILLADGQEPGKRSLADIDELRSAWPHLSEERRAYLLLTIPPSWKSNQPELLADFEREVTKPTIGRLSKIIWIMTRIRVVDDPLLIAACGSDDGDVKAVAEFIRSLSPSGSE